MAASSMPWATVTCGWYGNCSSRATGPEASRTCFWSQVQASAPWAIRTYTTGDSGRKVPVPDSFIGKGRPVAATSVRCASMAGSAVSATSVGGSRVTWVGMP